MDFKQEKQVRFYTGENGKSNFDHSWQIPERQLPEHKISAPLLMNNGKSRPISTSNHMGTIKLGKFSEENSNDSKGIRVLDPGSEVILQWNRIFLFSCLVALFVDPLFFYLPSVANGGVTSCMLSDLKLGIVVTCLRTIADIFYMSNIFIKFRTAYVSPSSRVLGRGELVMDPEKIARRYLKSNFFIDLVATLPLPQIVIWFIIPAIRTPKADHTTNALVLIVLLQYIPRLYLIFPLSTQIIKTTGVVTKTAWAGAAYNLGLYMLASHVLGASWYLLSFERHATCWKETCHKDKNSMNCSLWYLDCGSLDDDTRNQWANGTTLFDTCNPDNTNGSL